MKGRAQSSSNCLVNHLGQLQCGDPPDISIAGVVKMSDLVKLELMTVKYRCPEGQQIAGPAKGTFGEEGKWIPGEEERTSCHQD